MTKASSAAAMVETEDEWVAAAMTDDQMVAELLLRLKEARMSAAEKPVELLPPLRWGVRQRRSRFSRYGVSGVVVGVGGGALKKETDSARGSPMTPLSWSGGSGSGASASPSSAATADGFEDTSRQASCSTSAGSGSKAFPANEITSGFSKRSKKKKTFSQLKDEENLLLKERLNLEKEIATMRTTVKEQSARNVNLKRIKLDMNSDCVKRAKIPVVDRINKSNLDGASNPISSRKRETPAVKEETNPESWSGGFFMLPDLNMTPAEDDTCAQTLYGAS